MDLMSLLIRIGADTREAEEGIERVQKDMQDTESKSNSFLSKAGKAFKNGTKIAAGFAGGVTAVSAAAYKLATGAASTADHIDKMSQKIGLSREAYQELDFIMSQSGTSVDSLQMGFKTLRSQMKSASQAGGYAGSSFEKLGISMKNADGSAKSADQVFYEAVEALQGIDDETKKATLATELFGRSGSELMPLLNGAVGSMDEMKAMAHELGLVMDDEAVDAGVKLTDTIDQAKRAFDVIVTQLGVKVMPIVQEVLEWVVKHMPEIRRIIDVVFEGVQYAIKQVVKAFEGLYEWVEPYLPKIIDTIITAFRWALVYFWKFGNYIKYTLIPTLQSIWETVSAEVGPKLEEAWGTISEIFSTAFEAIKGYWENTLKPAWEELVAFVTETLWPAIQDIWETKIQPTIETVFNAITGFWNETLKPAWEDLIAFCEETLFPKIQEIWETMVQPIVENVFQAWQTLWEETIKPVFEGIIAFFQDVFKGDWDSAWQDIGGIFEGIWNGFETIVQTNFENIQTIITGALEAIGIDTEGLKKTYLEPLQEFISGAFKAAWDALSTFFSETLPNAISTVSTALNDFWNNVIIPVKDYVSDKFLAAWTEIKSYWETDLEPRIQALKDAFNTFKDNVLSPVANFVTGTFKSAWDTISKFFNGDVGDSVSKVGSGFDNLKKKFLKPLADWVNGAFKAAWDGMKDALNGLLDFITGVFEGDWKKAWQGLIDMISAPFNTLKTVLKEPINAVIRMINSMISKIESAINKVVDGINNHLRIDVDFGWNPFTGQSLGGIHWGANLSRVNWGRIDELYKGGVLRSGQHALVGEGGPEYIRMMGEHAFVQPLSKDNPLNNRGATFNATFNITARPGQNVEELAREIERVMTRWTTQKAVAFA